MKLLSPTPLKFRQPRQNMAASSPCIEIRHVKKVENTLCGRDRRFKMTNTWNAEEEQGERGGVRERETDRQTDRQRRRQRQRDKQVCIERERERER